MNSPRPNRRTLLRGGLLLGATAATAAATVTGLASATTGGTTGKARRTLDYPGATWTPAASANFTAANRPGQYPIDYVVIHVTQETYRDTVGIFQNPKAQVSAHYVVRSKDGFVGQCVHDKDVAWHAGNWEYNTRSIGIEHEGWVDKPEYFTAAMYESSAALTAHVCATYGIPVDRRYIIGHNEVPGATHTDPGELWDWARYIDLVKAAR